MTMHWRLHGCAFPRVARPVFPSCSFFLLVDRGYHSSPGPPGNPSESPALSDKGVALSRLRSMSSQGPGDCPHQAGAQAGARRQRALGRKEDTLSGGRASRSARSGLVKALISRASDRSAEAVAAGAQGGRARRCAHPRSPSHVCLGGGDGGRELADGWENPRPHQSPDHRALRPSRRRSPAEGVGAHRIVSEAGHGRIGRRALQVQKSPKVAGRNKRTSQVRESSLCPSCLATCSTDQPLRCGSLGNMTPYDTATAWRLRAASARMRH